MNRVCPPLLQHIPTLAASLATCAEEPVQALLARFGEENGEDGAEVAAQALLLLLAVVEVERRQAGDEGEGLNGVATLLGSEDLGDLWPLWRLVGTRQRHFGPALDHAHEDLVKVGLSVERLPEFYEQLMGAGDVGVRRRLGVFYTPQPLAAHMVELLDTALREAGLMGGLLDGRSYADLGWTPPTGVAPQAPVAVLLEPAAGMGIFLQELVRFAKRTGCSELALAGLLQRVRAFEIQPVACVLSRLLLRCVLREQGFCADLARLPLLVDGDFLAAIVQRDPRLVGVSVVLGNPPYARSSRNKSEDLRAMMARYRVGLEGERNIQPLADDYIKFVRGVELTLAAAPLAVTCLVTNHSFLRGRLHRAMRSSLAESFPQVHVLDLHGNTKVRRPGQRDENIFGIAQGVAVTLGVRPPGGGTPRLTYRELRGRRVDKLACLQERRLPRPQTLPLDGKWAPCEPLPREYDRFVPLDELFDFYSVGGKPGDDSMLVGFEPEQLLSQLQVARGRLCQQRYGTTEAARRLQKRPLSRPFQPEGVIHYAYRPFDDRVAYYEPEIWTRPLRSLYARVDGRPILLTTRIVKDERFAHVFVTRCFPDVIALSPTSSVNCYAFPLATMRPEPLCEATGMQLTREEAFAYVYAALHSHTYRSRYLGGLRDGFPRVPVMKEAALIASLVARGGRLLALHLGEAAPRAEGPRFVDGGDRQIRRVPEDPCKEAPDNSEGEGFSLGVNERSCFEAVPRAAWSFRVGGYQVCRKWLLDRRRAGRQLSDHDVRHYCDMVARVQETVQLQRDIDSLIERFGGFPGAVHGG